MSRTVIDFHSHILPGVDHGSPDLATTEQQLKLLCQAKTDVVVATSHFYPNAIDTDTFLKIVDRAARQIVENELSAPKIALGAEVLYCDGIEQMEGLERLCVRATNVLLLELPMDQWNSSLFHSVRALCKHYTVVLAHIDRYVASQTNELEELLSLGAYAQINASSLASFFKRCQLRAFLEKSGVHICGDTQNVVYLGNGYIGLHSAEGEKKALRLPHPMRVSAVYGADFSETVTDRIEFDLEENGTALFALR